MNIDQIFNDAEEEIKEEFNKIDKMCEKNSEKVLNAFRNNKISEAHFSSTTGYGYSDIGRDGIEKVFAEVLGAEDSLVRSQFISGSHALTVALFSYLRPNDTMLSISGLPYDTLHEVIGIVDNDSSLKSFGINYEQIDLIDNDFDYEKIKETLSTRKIKLVEIQRSKGYSTRKSITIDKIEKVIKEIRSVDKEVIIMVDNCYCEFVEDKTPIEVGADIIVGSLIKNLGGGIAPNGAYIAGRKDLIDLAGERLTLPGEGREVGPTLGINKSILQGIFFAPSVVASALKTAVLASKVLENLGYDVEPKYNDHRCDIVQNIIFNDPDKLIKFCQGIQAGSPIDSFAIPEPWDMPGYVDKVIMAAGAFTQGSSIEISCDGPIRSPYIAYLQGGLTYEYGKLAIKEAVKNLQNN
ncbi:MAG: methionine gamma-lyase family protein [Bacilli bacterium]|nr:methionine gamma-lyase family protein [Bacilli bacterium]MBO6195586.1 methionine gamma-lyase family protein [Bacilli bacterium]